MLPSSLLTSIVNKYTFRQKVEICRLYGLGFVWLNGLVVSAFGIRAGVRFPGRATIPLGNNLGQVVYSHCLPVSQLKETGYIEGVFDVYVVMVVKCARLS